MKITNNYIAVKEFVEPEQGGVKIVKLTNSSLFKGVVVLIPEAPVFLGNERVNVGDVVYFAKYSPDTHEIEHDGQKLKFINTRDLLAAL